MKKVKVVRTKYKGPFIGILTSDGGFPFQGNHSNFADIIRAGKSMGIAVFVVTPKSFQFEDNLVTGYILQPTSKKIQWEKADLPMPHAIYNRVPTRKREQSNPVQELLGKLEKAGIPVFNPYFFNKWKLYKELENSPQLKQLVPKSVELSTPLSLKKMILKYPTIYLKPIDGKAGVGMMRVTRLSEGFQLIYQSAEAKQHFTLATLNDLWHKVSTLKKKNAYVIQQGIQLATYQDSPFDLRMLLQKNIHGNWKITGIGIRVAGETAISTHVPQGGRIESADKVFKEVLADLENETIAYVKEMGLKTAQYIESHQSGVVGEMSIDWGLDKDGELWFFEANSKPMKFDEPDIRTLSLKRIIQFSVHLSGYKEVAQYATSSVHS